MEPQSSNENKNYTVLHENIFKSEQNIFEITSSVPLKLEPNPKEKRNRNNNKITKTTQ